METSTRPLRAKNMHSRRRQGARRASATAVVEADPPAAAEASGSEREPAGNGRSREPVPLRIAVLDGDSGFLVVLTKRIERLGWERRLVVPAVPVKRLAAMEIDVLVVDISVLGARAWSWLERLFAASPRFRTIVCTGSSTVTERVRGLQMGIDDWLTKPCHTEELVARIESVVGHRRRPEPREDEPIMVGDVEIRADRYQAYAGGSSLKLTRREFELIELLAGAGNEPVERELIYERLWGYPMLRCDRSVDVFVHKLRRKLAKASPQWRYIHTHWGLGYRFAAEPADALAAELLEIEDMRETPAARLAA
jgi:DNA-binding response OmpR family regulator